MNAPLEGDVAAILATLAEAREGDLDARAGEGPSGAPLRELRVAVDEILDVLSAERLKGAEYRQAIEEKDTTIELQRATINELVTPVIEVWGGVLCVPVIGVLGSARNAEMQRTVLHAIGARKARYVIIDITGIQVMDTSTADSFARMASAVRLLGAECALTGMSPAVAELLVQMGVDLRGIATLASVRDALERFIRSAGR